jgi:hypothetical protein
MDAGVSEENDAPISIELTCNDYEYQSEARIPWLVFICMKTSNLKRVRWFFADLLTCRSRGYAWTCQATNFSVIACEIGWANGGTSDFDHEAKEYAHSKRLIFSQLYCVTTQKPVLVSFRCRHGFDLCSFRLWSSICRQELAAEIDWSLWILCSLFNTFLQPSTL